MSPEPSLLPHISLLSLFPLPSPRVQRFGQVGAVLSEPGALVDFELEENDILGINRQSVRRAVGQEEGGGARRAVHIACDDRFGNKRPHCRGEEGSGVR